MACGLHYIQRKQERRARLVVLKPILAFLVIGMAFSGLTQAQSINPDCPVVAGNLNCRVEGNKNSTKQVAVNIRYETLNGFPHYLVQMKAPLVDDAVSFLVNEADMPYMIQAGDAITGVQHTICKKGALRSSVTVNGQLFQEFTIRGNKGGSQMEMDISEPTQGIIGKLICNR